MDRPLIVRPDLPQISITSFERLLDQGEMMSTDGEILRVDEADDASLVAWTLAAKHLREVARRMEDASHAIILDRVRQNAGPIMTEYGTAKESVSRGSITGAASARIRSILEEAASDGVISWDAADNVAPLVPHVTPAKAADYIDAIENRHPDLADELAKHLPEKRRTIKIETRSV